MSPQNDQTKTLSSPTPAGLCALIGTTASGKSDLALAVAEATGAHIISCDSLLVYKDFNIGTAKPSPQDLARAPHYGIDVASPDEQFNAGDFVRLVTPIIHDLHHRGIPVLLVGGTAFYLKALLCGQWETPAADLELRGRIEKQAAHLTANAEKGEFLHKILTTKDATQAAKIDPHDLYRIVRALEIIELTGKPVSELARQSGQKPLGIPCPVFGISRTREDLEMRIVARTQGMFSHGLVNEVKALMQRHPEARALDSVGYKEVKEFLQHRASHGWHEGLEEASVDETISVPKMGPEAITNIAQCRERIVIATRQLAKKQRTFFKTFLKEYGTVHWYDLPQQEDQLKNDMIEALGSTLNRE